MSQSWPLAFLALGASAGGLAFGVIAGLIALAIEPMHPARLGLLWGVGVLAALAALAPGLRPLLPQRACQVDAKLLTTSDRRLVALKWGWDLGLGFRTYLVTPAFYALAVVMVTEEPIAAVALGALYGFARGSTIVVFAYVAGLRDVSRDERLPGVGMEWKLRLSIALVACIAILTASAL